MRSFLLLALLAGPVLGLEPRTDGAPEARPALGLGPRTDGAPEARPALARSPRTGEAPEARLALGQSPRTDGAPEARLALGQSPRTDGAPEARPALGPVPASGVETSTAPVKRVGELPPLLLDLSGGASGTQLSLTYRVRLDDRDLLRLGPNLLRHVVSPFRAVRWLGGTLRAGTLLRFYGVRIRPGDLVQEVPAEAGPTGPGGAPGAAPVRRRLTLAPILEDLWEDLPKGVLSEGLGLALPQSRRLSSDQRLEFLSDVVRAQRDIGLPLLELPADGVDYLIQKSTATD